MIREYNRIIIKYCAIVIYCLWNFLCQIECHWPAQDQLDDNMTQGSAIKNEIQKTATEFEKKNFRR